VTINAALSRAALRASPLGMKGFSPERDALGRAVPPNTPRREPARRPEKRGRNSQALHRQIWRTSVVLVTVTILFYLFYMLKRILTLCTS